MRRVIKQLIVIEQLTTRLEIRLNNRRKGNQTVIQYSWKQNIGEVKKKDRLKLKSLLLIQYSFKPAPKCPHRIKRKSLQSI